MKYPLLSFFTIAVIVFGSGCGNSENVEDRPVSSRGTVVAANEIIAKYDNASINEDGETRTYQSDGSQSVVSVMLPTNWIGEGPMWKPNESSKSSVRVASFDSGMAIKAWTDQQTEDVHQVLGMRDESGRYLLVVYHPTLDAYLIKVFIPASETISGYLLGECRITSADKDNQSLWNACKMAMNSVSSK
jgi:hypothetical protein